MHSAQRARAGLSSHPSALSHMIFIPVMSNWLGARARRKQGSAELQLSRQRSIQDTQRKLILLQCLTAQTPNKAPSPDSYLIAFSHSFSLRKRGKVEAGNPPPKPLNHIEKEKQRKPFLAMDVKLQVKFEQLQKSLSFAQCHLG